MTLLALILALVTSMTAAQAPPAQPFPFDPSRRHDRDFRPSGSFTRLSPNLYVLDDTCNVYLVKSGNRGLLVGFGSGAILRRLREAGIDGIDHVLITHFHRNQSQGLVDLKPRPFQVTVPAAEARFFEDAEGTWRDMRQYINYDCRSWWNAPRASIRIDRRISPGETIEWRGLKFLVLETPGVTTHAVSYVADIDGKRIAFSGDLIAGPGKVPNWYDLHWDYYGFTQGMDASATSFARIRAERPDRFMPAHGSAIDDPAAAMDANLDVYATLKPMLLPNELHRVHQEVRQILPHLVFVGANCYAIVSRSGKAFLWDYGYVERERLEELKQNFGVKSIDAASFSHYHDDHIIRAWELTWENSSLWIHRSMLDVMENPSRYRLPCLVPMPIRADRVLGDTETVQWEEYAFQFYHLPGQTQFHAGLTTTIDGKKVMFTGDNTWNKKDAAATRNGPLVPHNEYFLDGGFIACADRMLLDKPDIVCPAHTEEYSPTETDLKGFRGWALRLRDIMTSLIDQPDPNFGMDVRWCRFYPYRSSLSSGSGTRVELYVRNHLFRPAQVEVELRSSAGILCDAAKRSVRIEAKGEVSVPFILRRATGAKDAREIVTADITINGKRVGEFAEAIVDPGQIRR
jgi:glyoxylase-like metal-dependent hydrolase (beta-lactamase superfamily II)